ncbi:MAG TPA: SapC family protein [Sphingomicrobium sp.]|nr:SapC family protein [Sphingomicrobium sp.]
MAELEVLNSKEHRSLRLRRDPGPFPHFVPIVVSEFPIAAASCPILLAKDPENGRFYAAAMFGFKPGENLLADSPGGMPEFRPLTIERQGFFTSGENIAVDLKDPRISETTGEPLFDEASEPTAALRRIQKALGLLVTGNEMTETFIRELVDLRLVEPIDISLKFDDGETLHLEGLYTVSLDAIAELEDDAVLSLFRKGYLQLAYCIAGSLRQIPILANRRNARLAECAGP